MFSLSPSHAQPPSRPQSAPHTVGVPTHASSVLSGFVRTRAVSTPLSRDVRDGVPEELMRRARWYKSAQSFVREYNHRIGIVLHEPPYESPFGPPPYDYNSGWGHLGEPLAGLHGSYYATRHERGEIDPAPNLSRNYNPPLPRYRPLRVSDLADDDLYGSGWFSDNECREPCMGWDTLAVENDTNPPPPLAPLILDLSFTRIMTYDERMSAWETYLDYCEMVDACASRRVMCKLPTVPCNRLVPCMRCRLHCGVFPGTRALYEPAAQRDLDWALQERNEARSRRNAVIAFRASLTEPEPVRYESMWWPYGPPPRQHVPAVTEDERTPPRQPAIAEQPLEELKRDVQELEQKLELLLKQDMKTDVATSATPENEELVVKREPDY